VRVIVIRFSVRVGVGVGMSVRVGMVVAVVVSRTVLVLMLVAVLLAVVMLVTVLMSRFMVMSANTCRSFSGQSASAIFTHQSISKEATSISRPARSSPLGL
jgi:hypothetical protein